MEKNNALEELDFHIMELHNIARNLEHSHIMINMASKIRAVADELHFNVTNLRHDKEK